ncbi:MAG: NAD(P)H-hydrate dehydratase [Gemmatimonadaceae bacterium]
MTVRIATAAESMECEMATMATGIAPRTLMERAGQAAAEAIVSRFPLGQWTQVTVATGPGNNGGDGWIVAGLLAARGYRVRVAEAVSARSPDAIGARDRALAACTDSPGSIVLEDNIGSSRLIVDALLGTGSTGTPQGKISPTIESINSAHAAGVWVVALDVPSGVNATNGSADGAIRADLTLAFGTLKRGHLTARDFCGEVLALDIGLTESPAMAALPTLIDTAWAQSHIPVIPWTAHKGTRKRLAVIGGGVGMAGAALLAGRGALRSGIGLLHLIVNRENIGPVHAGVPQALVSAWPEVASDTARVAESSDVIAIGPGLGRSDATRELVERVMLAFNGPLVLDADALNVFENDAASLATLIGNRLAILTPHPAELGRLLGTSVDDVLARRFDIGMELARSVGAVVLLKGTPTVVFVPGGERYVIASGTAALATGGSGDILTGVCATLLSQMSDAGEAAACSAFVHGRAAELCNGVRGITLDDVLEAMPAAWNENATELPAGVLAMLDARK